jgi:aspartyl-tRNA(Asn)/glutamyl-tRNA(Gln) amidotransferase subunit A
VTRSWPAVSELAASIEAGEPAGAAAGAVSALIAELDTGARGLNAFLSHDPAGLAAAAAAVDESLARGRAEGRRAGPLAGVPVAVKDNLCTTDHPTTCGSRMLEGFRSPYDATVVRRLRAAGALIAGKTNLDEFGMGSSTETSAFGPTRNPRDRDRVPGGSSGGSAAAVAAGMVPVALGSDTGGSVRQPAALCGVVGVKPTYGAVSRYGLVAYASSLDQVGVFGRTVDDAVRVLQAIAGPDPLDATCATGEAPDLVGALGDGVERLVVGVPEEYFPNELDAGVRRLAERALEELARAGAEVRPISLPHTRLAIPAYYVLAPAEASSNLARYDGARYGFRAAADSTASMYARTRSAGFGAEVKRRILLGTFALSAGYHEQYYGRAQRARSLITADFRAAFDSGVHVLFTPTSPGVAFRLGERLDDPLRMYLADVFTVTANLAGLPAASVPIGTLDGLPVGGQLLADRWGEAVMVRAAAALERAGSGGGVGGGSSS